MPRKKPGPPKGQRFGGKPKGYKAPKTVEKEFERERLRQMVVAELEPLVRAQIAHAKGIDHFFMRNPKTKQFERVTDPDMIQAALNAGDRESYYWIFTKDPSAQSFTGLIDRALDKPKEQAVQVEVTVTPAQLSDAEIRARVAAIAKGLRLLHDAQS